MTPRLLLARAARLAACLAAGAGALLAQAGPPQDPAAPAAPTPLPPPADELVAEAAWKESAERDDYRELVLFGGFRVQLGSLGIEVRGRHALLLSDREAARALLQTDDGSGLPRRGIPVPAPRRRLTADQVRARLDRTLSAIGQPQGLPSDTRSDQAIDLLRYFYAEGGVTVVRDGVEVLRCERLWISPLDDRIVVEDAELRYRTPGKQGGEELVVRGARLTKQGGRWTGRDLTLTTCTAAEPHIAAEVGEAEIIEREGEFEVVARDQTLRFGGVSLLPLPDARFFTKSQGEFPIKRASAGYSQREGVRTELVLGLPWNRTGGAVHEWLTGRSPNEFRGDWELGVGWIEKRGVPLSGGLTYGAQGLYQGRTDAFVLDDQLGRNLREIQTNVDGSTIDTQNRSLLRTENRVWLGESTHLDVQAFTASDAAVYSEFFRGDYRSRELPETSTYLHHADRNRLLTVGTRFSLDDFSYRDDRALADRFVEEYPVVTYHWLAQPIGETPWATPLVLDIGTELGQRRSAYDDLAGARVSDRTFRADQNIELSAPLAIGPLNLRPFAAARGTWVDEAIDGADEGRIALEAGVQAGTRLSRTWRWQDQAGPQALRHVVAPRFTFANRFRVDDQPAEFHRFDQSEALPEQYLINTIDSIREQNLVRFELRNLVQRIEPDAQGKPKAPHDLVYLDLAQDFWPDEDRDNGGDTLGLFYYDLQLRPTPRYSPFETFVAALYGDHDWDDGMRTFDAELQFGPLAGLTWTADYREDRVTDGAVGFGARTRLLGRWDVFAGAQRDLDRDLWLNYTFGLRRDDHDWSLAVNFGYDPFADQTTFRIEFLPRFGGQGGGRRDSFGDTVAADRFLAN